VQIGLARGSTIWVPFGMGLAQQTTEAGFKYTDHLNRLTLTYDYLAHFTVHRSFDALVADLVNRGFTIEYSKVYRDEFFVVSASDQKTDTYIRYHQFGEGGLGFSLYWNHDSLEIHGERIATLISGSLWSSLTGAPFTTPFTIPDEVQVAVVQPPPTSAPPQQISPPVLPSAPSMVATLPPPESKPKSEGSSGTGFFVTKEGLVLTNAHVVKDCAEIRIAPPQGSFTLATLFARDATNDLALLKTTGSPIRTASLRPTIRLGENVEAFGYPLSTVLATSGNFTLGNVTALAGLRDDSRYLQISAPVQPGNSGGPLLDQNGNLVGVVSAKLNALNVMLATNGDIPQNVNFAIKASVAANFLQTNGVKYENGDATLQLQPADIADQAKSMSVFVECR
jgi:serine protease Do